MTDNSYAKIPGPYRDILREAGILAALSDHDREIVVSLIAYALGEATYPAHFLINRSRDALARVLPEDVDSATAVSNSLNVAGALLSTHS